MAALVLAAGGAAIGASIVGGTLAAQIGWSVGAALGSYLTREKIHQQQPLMDLKVVGIEYGHPIPWIRGTMPLPGILIWNSDRNPIYTSTTQGGKGGGPEVTSTTVTYTVDLLYMLCEGEIAGISRIWDSGELIYTARAGDPIDSLNASVMSEHWDRMTVYPGTETQLPDPDYEDAVGAGNAPAHRGYACVFIKGLKLGSSGQMRNLLFEVVRDGASGGVPEPRVVDVVETLTVSGSLPQTAFVEENTGWIWHVDPPFTSSGDYNVKVINETGEEIIADFFKDDIGALDIMSCIFSVPILNEVWIAWVRFGDTVRFAVFDAGHATSTGGLVEAPYFKEYIELDDARQDTSIPYRYCSTAKYDPVMGLVTTAGASNGSDVANIGVIEPAFRRLLKSYNSSSPLGYPTSMCGAYPTFAFHGVYYGHLNNDNFAVLDIGNHLIWATTRIADINATSFQNLAYDPLNNLWWAVDAGTLNYQTIDYNCNITNRVISSAVGGDTSPAPSMFAQGIAYVPTLESMAIGANGNILTVGTTIYIIDVDTFTSSHTFTYEMNPANYAPPLLVPKGLGSRYLLCFDEGYTPSHLRRMYYHAETLVNDPPSVSDVQRDICLRAGMTTDQIDVSSLSSITRLVRGIAWSDISNARGLSEQLMTAFFYEATLSGNKIKFVPRGSASVATIPFDDLGSSTGGDFTEPLPLKHINDIEQPARMALIYPNTDSDYQSDTQYTDRHVSASADTVESMTLAIAMTASEAKSVIETVMGDRIATALSTKIALLGDYTKLEATDPVTITAHDGSLLRMRIVKGVDAFPLLEYELVLDDTSILSQQGITSTDYTSSNIVTAPTETVVEYMDIPMLLDAHDDAGFYVAAEGNTQKWPGAAILKSIDDVSYTQQVTIEEPAIIGRTTTTLGGWSGGRVFDEVNTVRVDIGDGTLNSTTRDALLADESVNAALIGDDHLFQFRTATLISAGVYDLSGLLHADHGMTSIADGAEAGARFVLLRYAGLRRVNMDVSELGSQRYYKGVTFGRPVSSATSRAFTNNGTALKPLAPFDLRAARDNSGNITFTWQRRSRLSVRIVGTMPPSIPLGESSEAYYVRIYNGDWALLKTISATTTSASYTAAEQTTDFGSPQSSLNVGVCMVSDSVGAGYEFKETV